jgi:putative flippase GtrA
MLFRFWQHRVVRFLTVGVFNTLLDLCILNSLVFFVKLYPIVANLFSASISISVSFFLNHRIVFRSNQPITYSRFIYFFAVTGIGILVVQSLVILFMVHLLGSRNIGIRHILGDFIHPVPTIRFVNLNVAKLTAVLVAMIWNFCFYKFVIFKEDGAEEIASATSIV